MNFEVLLKSSYNCVSNREKKSIHSSEWLVHDITFDLGITSTAVTGLSFLLLVCTVEEIGGWGGWGGGARRRSER